ncbi:MAG: hypothetical protein OJF50_000056 [Nitrospira sp.]|nr:hypothetical protein [Nitrospira sp.]
MSSWGRSDGGVWIWPIESRQDGLSDTPGLWVESAIDILCGGSRYELSGTPIGRDVRE